MTQRITLSEITTELLAAVKRGGSDHSSVELTRNARGHVQIRVNVYAGEAEIASPEDAAARAVALFDQLRERYPLPESPEAGEA